MKPTNSSHTSSPPSSPTPLQQAPYLFDNPRNIKRVLRLLYLSCAGLLLLDFILHRHIEHPWEQLMGFYALYGFVGCVVLVLLAKGMRVVLKRPENYYQPPAETTDKPATSRNHGSTSQQATSNRRQANRHVDD